MIYRFVSRRPFLTLWLVTLVLWVLWWTTSPLYDDAGWGSLLFFAAHFLGVVFYLSASLLYVMVGELTLWHHALVILMSSIPYALGDRWLADWRQRGRSLPSAPDDARLGVESTHD